MKSARYILWGFFWCMIVLLGFTAAALSRDNLPDGMSRAMANTPAGLAMLFGVCGIIGIVWCAMALGQGNAAAYMRLKVGHIYCLFGKVGNIFVVYHFKSDEEIIVRSNGKEFNGLSPSDRFVWTKDKNVYGKAFFKAKRLAPESSPPADANKIPLVSCGSDLV